MSTKSDPASGAQNITPSDSVILPFKTKGIYIGTGGNVRVVSLDGNTVDFIAPVGVLIPIVTSQVLSTGTTALNIVGLY